MNKWNDYQREYQKTNYSQLTTHLDKELVSRFKAKLKEDNKTYASFLRNVINKYLNGEYIDDDKRNEGK